MALLTCRDLALGYDGNALIEHLDFSIEEGDYLCIVGENGSGKTTLMRTLLGLIRPISGRIEFADKDIGNRGRIGYLPQQTVVQRDFPASVREIVLSGCQARSGFHPFYSKEDKAVAEQNMRRMEISDLQDKCYRDLSGGQQQRVLLARALCAAGRILLLDEPVTGLDPRVTAQMYELIKKLNQEGLTIIMISHDVEAAVRYATHILHIGNKVFFGTREEYTDSKIGKMFLWQGSETENNDRGDEADD